MPKKKTEAAERALTIIDQPKRDVVVTLNGGREPVPVEATYLVPKVHPSAPGPWSGEHDKVAWRDAATGYPCIIRRSPITGHLGGYVAVPPGHPVHGWPASALIGLHVAVHNSISYAAACERGMPEALSICHVAPVVSRPERQVVHRNAAAEEPHDDAWWFGFECNGPGDVLPDDRMRRADGRPLDGVVERTYRDEAFVHGECTRLAMQFAAIAAGRDPVEALPSAGDATDHRPSRIGR